MHLVDHCLLWPTLGLCRSDSCLHHCGGWGSYKINGMVQGPAFQKWYEGGEGVNIQGQTYPCASCCTPGGNTTEGTMASVL